MNEKEKGSTDEFADNIESYDVRMRNNNNLLKATEIWTTFTGNYVQVSNNKCDHCVHFGPGRVNYNEIH